MAANPEPVGASEAYLIIAAINALLELLAKAQERAKQSEELSLEKEIELDTHIEEIKKKIAEIQYPEETR